MNYVDSLSIEEQALHWKHVAAWIASCSAATLESLPKSASRRQRERHVSIVKKSAEMLRGIGEPKSYGFQPKSDQIEWDIQRCEKAIAEYGERS